MFKCLGEHSKEISSLLSIFDFSFVAFYWISWDLDKRSLVSLSILFSGGRQGKFFEHFSTSYKPLRPVSGLKINLVKSVAASINLRRPFLGREWRIEVSLRNS